MKTNSVQTLADLPPAYREALCVFEAFRRLGIAAEDIYMGFGNVGNVGVDCLYVQARQGALEFNFTVAQLLGHTEDQVHETWTEAVRLWNAAPQEETQPIWEAAAVKKVAEELVVCMYQKGFRFPDRTAN
jgi:hypothetical protein